MNKPATYLTHFIFPLCPFTNKGCTIQSVTTILVHINGITNKQMIINGRIIMNNT